MAFCAAKEKPGATRAIRGFAQQKSHQFMRTFLCNFLLCGQKKVDKKATHDAIVRS
jgi:hypothetical protein